MSCTSLALKIDSIALLRLALRAVGRSTGTKLRRDITCRGPRSLDRVHADVRCINTIFLLTIAPSFKSKNLARII